MSSSDIGIWFGCQNQIGLRSDTLHSYGHQLLPPPQFPVFKLEVLRLAWPFSLPIHCRSGIAPVWTISGPDQMRTLGWSCFASAKIDFQSTLEVGALNPSNSIS